LKKRNYDAMQRLDPARIDAALLGRLIDKFGHERQRTGGGVYLG
jgi:hypothetical protein